MLSLLSRCSILQSGVLRGATDWHCHLLPGVDDGSPTLADTLALLAVYRQAGISEVWLTPHIMEDYPNTPARLRQCFDQLLADLRTEAGEHPAPDPAAEMPRLRLAAEHMLDNLFPQRLAKGDVLPIGPRGDHLLVETSYFNPPLRLHDTLRSILAQGLRPLLAHPERFVYMQRPDYLTLLQMGVRLQVNLPSLAGAYGPEAQHKAQWLVKEGHVTLLGTDAHRLPALQRALNTPTRFIRRHTALLSQLSHAQLPG